MDNTLTIIALANQKGGVAKTTCTYNLAAVKAKQGHRVLMIDLDPQASLTISCGMSQVRRSFSTIRVTYLTGRLIRQSAAIA